MEESQSQEYTLVARKPYFGLPTACPICLPVYIYLKLAQFPFRLDFNSTYPDSDQIPYVESGTYVAYNNESGGVIQRLKEDGIVNLDAEVYSVPEWISMEALVSSWLVDALTYELWLGTEGSSAFTIYYSDLPWIIGRALFAKQVYDLKQRLGITKENAERREEEIYKRAKIAYGALSTRLGDQDFLFDNRPSSLDAFFLAHMLFTLQALPETSVLRRSLSEHSNLITYAEKLKTNFLEASTSSGLHADASPPPRRGPLNSSSKTRRKPKREKTEEEKTFKKRAKYFLAAQAIAILVFLSVMGGHDPSAVDVDDDDLLYD